VARLRGNDVELGEPRFVRRAMAEVAIDRLAERALVNEDDVPESPQPIAPNLQPGIRIAHERGALQREQSIELLRSRGHKRPS